MHRFARRYHSRMWRSGYEYNPIKYKNIWRWVWFKWIRWWLRRMGWRRIQCWSYRMWSWSGWCCYEKPCSRFVRVWMQGKWWNSLHTGKTTRIHKVIDKMTLARWNSYPLWIWLRSHIQLATSSDMQSLWGNWIYCWVRYWGRFHVHIKDDTYPSKDTSQSNITIYCKTES